MERGEVHGRCGGLVSSIQSTRPDWFPKRMVHVPIQIALERSRRFPDVPSLGELTKDERTRQILQLIVAPDDMDRSIFAPPGTPPERVAALRAAFASAFKDPAFAEEAARVRIDIEYVSGEAVTRIVAGAYALPPEIVEAAKQAIGAL